jgi:histone H3/H4
MSLPLNPTWTLRCHSRPSTSGAAIQRWLLRSTNDGMNRPSESLWSNRRSITRQEFCSLSLHPADDKCAPPMMNEGKTFSPCHQQMIGRPLFSPPCRLSKPFPRRCIRRPNKSMRSSLPRIAVRRLFKQERRNEDDKAELEERVCRMDLRWQAPNKRESHAAQDTVIGRLMYHSGSRSSRRSHVFEDIP